MKLRHFGFLAGSLAGLFALMQPAWADARQDVMAATQRCAGIVDDRSWLDCFYGSAQPMRARLGLPPAPASQQRLVPPPQYGAPAYAQPAYPQPSYATPPPAAAYNNAPQVASAPAGPPPLPRRKSTGIFGSVFGSSKAVIANVRMASWSKSNGRFVVTLADGEIWQQDVGDNNSPNWRNPVSRHIVNIYEGALGSYNMNVSDDSALYKVHRIN